jgi:hypothetical protein
MPKGSVSGVPPCSLDRTQHQLSDRGFGERVHACQLGKKKGVPTTQWTCAQPHGRSRHHCGLKHSTNLLQDQIVAKVPVEPSSAPVTGGEHEKDLWWLVNACGARSVSKQSVEPRSRPAHGDEFVTSRVIGIKARRNTATAVHGEICPQRIAGAPARVRTPSPPFVKRAKQELRELLRCERDGSLPPQGLPSFGHQRVRWILGEEPRKVGPLESKSTPAVRRRPRSGLNSHFSSGVGLTKRNSCIPPAGARVEEQVVAGPPFFGGVEEPAPIHQRKDCQNCLLAMSYRRTCHLGCGPSYRQVVQEWKQVAVVNRYSSPGAGGLEGNDFPLEACERTWRKPERYFEWAFQRDFRWRPQGNARRELSAPTAQASCKEPPSIKAKEQRCAACPSATVRLALLKLVMDLGLATAESRKKFEDFEFAGRVDPDLAGGRAKEGSPVVCVDLYVGCERVGPQYRIRSHWRTAKSTGSEY